MNIQTLAASVLALGLLAPLSAIADDNRCSTDKKDRVFYIDCLENVVNQDVGSTKLFAVTTVKNRRIGPIGDYIDETPAESNHRSSSR